LSGESSITYPKPPDVWAQLALFFAALCVLAAGGATSLIRNSIAGLGASNWLFELILIPVVLVTAMLFWPATKAWRLANAAKAARLNKNAVQARIATAASKDQSALTFGWGIFALLALGFFVFIFMSETAVGRTFFLLPLLQEKWWLVTQKFITVNIVTFVIAEILVLIWGLIVALARMMPGKAGQPIRALATVYCDVFRGLPAIVTLYLIGFGIPTSGLPELIIPPIYGLFVDTSSMDVRTLRDLTRIPVMWWCILALTLTYGAYVAEVYRAGIESIHWSQVSAARSLGLSYLQSMRYVIVPQAVRRVMAPLLNDFIGLQKDTALVQILGLVDGFNQARGIAANAFNLSAVTIVAILFVLITIPQARLVDWLMERDAQRMKSGGH
jgi:polar amino acid transport system permease protein